MTGSNGVRVLTCDEVREMAGAFVLGALDPAEDASIRAHLETCADAHAEIAELGGVLPALAENVPVVEPPAGLKGRIMAAAAADLESRSGTTPAVAPGPGETWAPDAAMARNPSRTRRWKARSNSASKRVTSPGALRARPISTGTSRTIVRSGPRPSVAVVSSIRSVSSGTPAP